MRRMYLAMLRRLPQILRFVPGKAQDVRSYFLMLLEPNHYHGALADVGN